MDGEALSTLAEGGLEGYLERPMAPPGAEVLAAIESGPIDPAVALPLAAIDRLRDPAPLATETGWCRLPDGVAYVAVRTAMPGVSAEMVEWWFDWHPRDPLRYRIWHPRDHSGNSFEPPARPGAKPHWGAVHHPVEDVGTGTERIRISFLPPHELGFADDVLGDPAVATVVCGTIGDDRRRMRHSAMAHVFLRADDGLVLRSHFWLGAALRPYLPAPLAAPTAKVLSNRVIRRLVLPDALPRGLARHCAEEYANLAAILPELYGAYGEDAV